MIATRDGDGKRAAQEVSVAAVVVVAFVVVVIFMSSFCWCWSGRACCLCCALYFLWLRTCSFFCVWYNMLDSVFRHLCIRYLPDEVFLTR